MRLGINVVTNAVLDFSPDLILVDKKRLGVGNELSAALDLLQRRAVLPKLVLLLRDILDSPETTAEMWKKHGYHEAVRSFYDQILVVGSQEVFNLTTEYQFPASTRSKVQFCGYLRRDRGPHKRELIRRELRLDDE